MGQKIDQKSIKKGIEKTMEKRRASEQQKSRNVKPRDRKNPGFQTPGRGLGGGINPSPEGEGRDWNSTTALNHPAEAGGILYKIF